MMGIRIDETVRDLAEVVTELRRAEAQLRRDLAGAEADISRAERRLAGALQGMPIHRWQALVSEHAPIRSAGDSRDAHRAKKHRTTVEAALGEVAAVRASGASKVALARSALEEAQGKLVEFGPLAIRLWVPDVRRSSRRTGLPDERSSIQR